MEPVDALREYLFIQESGARHLPPLTGWEMVMQLKDWEEALTENGAAPNYEDVVGGVAVNNQEAQEVQEAQEGQEGQEGQEEEEIEEPPTKRT